MSRFHCPVTEVSARHTADIGEHLPSDKWMHSGCGAGCSTRFLWVLVPEALTSLQSPPVLSFHFGQTMFGCMYQKTASYWFHSEKSLLLHLTRSPEVLLAPGLGSANPVLSVCFFSLVQPSGQNPCSGHRVMPQHGGQQVSTFSPGFPTWIRGFFFRMGSSSFRSRPTSDSGVSVDALHQLLYSGFLATLEHRNHWGASRATKAHPYA